MIIWCGCALVTNCNLFSLTRQIGTFTTHSGEYFLEPLMKADGEEDEEEHNKPHLIYKHERKKRPATGTDHPEPCASSGNGQLFYFRCKNVMSLASLFI